MAHYRHLHRNWAATASHEAWSAAARFQPSSGSIPVNPATPRTHVYLYPNICWFPLQYVWNMPANSDDSSINHHRLIDGNLVIDASTSPRTAHDQQQMIDGHSIIDLNLLPSYNTDHFSGQEERGDVRNRNRGGRLSEEAISKHVKTRAATREDTTEICTVCQDDLHEEGNNDQLIMTLDCGHEYHANCIKRWLRRKNVCPLCNAVALPDNHLVL